MGVPKAAASRWAARRARCCRSSRMRRDDGSKGVLRARDGQVLVILESECGSGPAPDGRESDEAIMSWIGAMGSMSGHTDPSVGMMRASAIGRAGHAGPAEGVFQNRLLLQDAASGRASAAARAPAISASARTISIGASVPISTCLLLSSRSFWFSIEGLLLHLDLFVERSPGPSRD